MEDAEGLSFDFEGGLDTGPAQPTASVPVVPSDNSSAAVASLAPSSDPSAAAAATAAAAAGAGRGRSFRQTVCRHWLRGLCMKGDACGFLHQYDKARMPVCRFFRLYGECREQDCVYKHTNEDIKECNMYKLGFCPNGPDCRYRHAKLPGPPPSVEEVFQKIQQLTSYGYGPNRFYQQRNVSSQQTDKPQLQGPSTVSQGQPQESGNLLQQQEHQRSQQQVSQTQTQNPVDQTNRTAHPLPQGVTRYFIVKSCNRENLELSVQQGVWATQRSNEAKLNEAFDSVENVILIFSVNRTRHFQGCAKMTSRIGGSISGGNWKHEHGTAQYGRNFSVKWLKLCELSFHKTRHLRNPYNDNLPVKISRDCQELEASIGEQLASLLYLEPDSELMAISLAAEAKREEEKAKGVKPDSGAGNPDIVPFEDNEEEEEEEEESDEEEDGLGAAAQGRGRGRGMMWPPQMPLARGGRPMPGMGGFPLGVMGADAFPYGPVGPGGFGMPDPFGVAPRPFGPYGPRFAGDFRGPMPGMMFPGRPPQPFAPGGFGVMGGPGRGPLMGGMGPTGPNAPRGGRPMYPPQQNQSQNVSSARAGGGGGGGGVRDQKTPERNNGGADKGVWDHETRAPPNNETPRQRDQFGTGNNNFTKEESESEDEAPRRSRHGEGKKK